ncbi:ThiF family adenylyltransferase [Candidatus Woesearchaeota archaeon]|nr:ThiF family adenylyltransferase [Candidatus Woesearchaeota archaeon]
MAFAISRYSRQKMLIGKAAQKLLLRSGAVVVGLGALGTVAAELLTRAGIGKLVIIDRDVVELTDLQRQLLYDERDVGKPKTEATAGKLRHVNSGIKIVAAAADIDCKSITKLVGMPDVVLDCTDNLETRFLINEYCLKNRLAWVHSAAIRDAAQLMAFDFRGSNSKNSPCFACVFGKSSAGETCDTAGVLASATTAIAAMQVTEALKMLLGRYNELAKGLLRLNVWQNNLTRIAVKRNPCCGSCNGNSSYDYLSGKKGSKTVSLCGRNSFQVKGKAVNLPALKLQLQKMGEKVAGFEGCISFRNITLFRDGRAIVKSGSIEKAKADYARYIGL